MIFLPKWNNTKRKNRKSIFTCLIKLKQIGSQMSPIFFAEMDLEFFKSIVLFLFFYYYFTFFFVCVFSFLSLEREMTLKIFFKGWEERVKDVEEPRLKISFFKSSGELQPRRKMIFKSKQTDVRELSPKTWREPDLGFWKRSKGRSYQRHVCPLIQ